MVDIFISYSRHDRERVRPYAEALEKRGYDVWWDVKIPVGQDFDGEIARALGEAKAVIVVWSKHSIDSGWVKEEADDGLARKRLVPILIDPVAIPLGFRRIQASDFTSDDPAAQETAWRQLCERIDQLAGAQGKAGSAPGPGRLSRSLTRWPILAAGLAGLLVLAAVIWMIMRPVEPGAIATEADAPPPPADMAPVVVGIYPSDSFGPLQKRGLHLALGSRAPETALVDLEAPIDAMKRRDAPQVIATLKTLLRDRNVVAIVGPSVTEFTPQVIAAVTESRRRPALLLTTAGPRRAIGWEGSDLPIFRVGSGIDERARQFAEMATTAISRGRKLIFLVESSPNGSTETYGGLFFRAISQYLPEWETWFQADRISRTLYERGRAVESLRALQQTDIFDGDNVVFVLGIGSDYAALASAFFTGANPTRRAALGGWMNAHAMTSVLAERGVQADRLFDISDVWQAPPDRADDPALQVFRRQYQDISPARRDETILYDSGLVIARALAQAGANPSPDRIVEFLRSQRFRGISGDILFGPDGQNRGAVGGVAPLNIVRFDTAGQRWVRLTSIDAILTP